MNVNPIPYAETVEAASKLLESPTTVQRNGKTASIESGFAVGGACRSISVPIHHPDFDYERWAVEIALWMQSKPIDIEYFGSWESDDKLILDGVSIVESIGEAEALAIIRGERCVWDFANGREVAV